MKTGSLFRNAQFLRTVDAGQIIYAEGERGTHMYGVVSGEVELRKGLAVVAKIGPDGVFGERALIDELPRNLTAVAVVDSILADIDRSLFLFLVHETPTFALGIMDALASRLREYDDLIGGSSSNST